MEQQTSAMTNRSLRSIRNEVEYLVDINALTSQQSTAILALLPAQSNATARPLSSMPTPPPSSISDPVPIQNLSLNEKRSDYYAPSPAPALPPPAYSTTAAPTIATASAIYEYNPTDAGDLPLLPNDRILITEYMNADWAKGRNERTGAEGIFPRTFIKVLDEKSNFLTAPRQKLSNYGNMPLDVSQGNSGNATEGKESKLNENGKKFGKKLGNAAIFGAGATVGSKIVDGIF
ncbi:hypothetical protein MMC07_006633 [Pseudocyphellaria aurata]|nr:hypothetical protein [Pseudocyphellaria aurata]